MSHVWVNLIEPLQCNENKPATVCTSVARASLCVHLIPQSTKGIRAVHSYKVHSSEGTRDHYNIQHTTYRALFTFIRRRFPSRTAPEKVWFSLHKSRRGANHLRGILVEPELWERYTTRLETPQLYTFLQ